MKTELRERRARPSGSARSRRAPTWARTARSTASEGLKKLHEVAAFTPDYDFKLKLVLKCHLTLIDYEDRTMGSAEA